MSVKVLVIGDPHFKVANSRDTDLLTQQVPEIAKQLQPDIIVCLGDLLDRHETIHVSPLDRATDFLFRLTTVAPTYLLVGNHDRPNNSNFLTAEHPFTAHKKWNNLTVVDTILTQEINGLKIIFAPYVPPGRFQEALTTTKTTLDGVTAIFSHQEWYGVQMGAITSTSGDVWPLDGPLVINGHIHDYSWTQPNLVNIGTPYQLNFGERDNKAISVFTLQHGGDYKSWEERISLQIPSKTIIHLKMADLTTLIIPEEATGYWKVVIEGTSAEMKHVIKHPVVKEWLKRGIKVVHREIAAPSELGSEIAPMKSITFLHRLRLASQKSPDLVELMKSLFP